MDVKGHVISFDQLIILEWSKYSITILRLAQVRLVSKYTWETVKAVFLT